MQFKNFLLAMIVMFIGTGIVGCSDIKKVSTPLGEGEYQTFLNGNGEPLDDGGLFLFVDSTEKAVTDENIVKFYDEVVANTKNTDFVYGIVKYGDYGLNFSPNNNIIQYGKMKADCSPLLANSRLESVEKYLVIEDGKVKTENN
jgi:hypothetical protein